MTTVLLFELDTDEENWIDESTSETMKRCQFVEARAYDMVDHEQCALQFTREMVLQGRIPDPDSHRLVVIGGQRTVEAMKHVCTGEELQPIMQEERVPFTVWEPVPPPPTPMWGVKKHGYGE